MKENFKKIIFGISIFYSFVIIILMIITINNMVTTIELHDTEENKVKLNEYKDKLSTLKQDSCTGVINEIINHYEETSYDGEVNLKEMYEYDFDNSLLSYYIKVKDNCNITDEIAKQYNLPNKFVTGSIQRDEIYLPYYFQYELGFDDYITRLIVEPQLYNTEYQINRVAELEIIFALIDISSKEATINE